jgi:large repetitive protein
MRARSLGAIALLVASLFAASVFTAPAALALPIVPPDPPQYVHLYASSTTSADIGWTLPANTGDSPLTAFHWEVTGPDSYDMTGSTDAATTDASVTGLIPGDVYTATVTALNADSTSLPASSPPLTVPTTFLGAVTDVQITPHQTTADVSWTPPAETGESAITGYDVLLLDLVNGATDIPVGLATSYTLTDLTPGTLYGVVIEDTNDTNTENTPGDTFTTLDYSAPGPASNIQVARATGANDFTVTFDTPSNDGGETISGYTVTATDETAGGSTSQSLDPSDRTAHFTDQVVGDDYTIAVTATNSIGTGDPATADFTLDAVLPTAVRGLTLVDNGDGVLEADWTAPVYDGGSDLTGYVAVVTDGDATTYAPETTPGGTATSALFDVPVVTAGTYTVAIEPVNAAGSGPSVTSDPVSTTAATRPDAPSIVSVNIGDLHDPYMQVGWVPNSDGGGPITTFTLRLYDVDHTLLRTVTVVPGSDEYEFQGLDNNTFYAVTVTATNAAGVSDESEEGGATMLAAFPPAPTHSELAATGTGFVASLTVHGHTAIAHIQDGPPGSWVYGYVYSSPQKLGWAQLDADGDATWTLPTLDPGVHQVAVLDSTGFLLGSRSFTVAGAVSTALTLAFTGVEPDAPLGAALAALLVGAVLLLLRRRAMNS